MLVTCVAGGAVFVGGSVTFAAAVWASVSFLSASAMATPLGGFSSVVPIFASGFSL
jgi:hypothetical protein